MEICVVSKGDALYTVREALVISLLLGKGKGRRVRTMSPALLGTSGTYFSSWYEKTPKKNNLRRRVCSGLDFVGTAHHGGKSRAKE